MFLPLASLCFVVVGKPGRMKPPPGQCTRRQLDGDRRFPIDNRRSSRRFPGWGPSLVVVMLIASTIVRPLSAQSTDAKSEPPATQSAADEDKASSGASNQKTTPKPVPLDQATKLPWSDVSPDRPSLPVRELGGPRELLNLYGVEDSQIESLFDGHPLEADEDEALVRILYRLPRFSLVNVNRWSQPLPPPAELVAEPDQFRVQMFRLEGRAKRVDRQALIPEMAELFEFSHYYRVQLQLDNDPHPISVCARRVPSTWPLGEPIDERVRIDALFLKLGDLEVESPELFFAADRVAWIPAEPRPESNVTPHQVLLAKLGMDISLLDDVRTRNARPIGKVDRECFYQMLRAASRLTPELTSQVKADQLDLAPLLTEPKTQHGRLIRCEANARRITRVEVNDPDIRERFGIDHYYQLDVFLPLGDRSVRLGTKEEDGPVFTNSFPATICVLELPEPLKEVARQSAANASQGESLNERVEVGAFSFKLWVYKSEFVDRQIAPMLIAGTLELIEFDTGRNAWLGLVVGVAFVGLLVAAWIGVWRFSRSDTKFERTAVKRQFDVPEGKSLNDMGIEAQDEPDFSNLD